MLSNPQFTARALIHTNAISMAEKMSDGTIVIRLASLIRVLLNVCVTDAEVDQVMEQVHSRVALDLRGTIPIVCHHRSELCCSHCSV